ncbi:MAG: Asp-tRNA(Asn)/Glu-tRNA(Gln) amidotransferase subunit GatC [bacterium]|nr:Asp-tRNA(Asn)/Glu-tRNA(Gln) amidotransferase subunit GatC [bacterium]
MTIEIKDVEHLAGLARIAVSEEEKKILQHDLEEILAYVSQIKEVEGQKSKVKSGELRNVMREDSEPHEAGIFTEDILKQAPAREGNRISVKKILGNS